MKIQEVVRDVTVDQPITAPKTNLHEPDILAVESSSYEETSSESKGEESAHIKMDLDLEDEK